MLMGSIALGVLVMVVCLFMQTVILVAVHRYYVSRVATLESYTFWHGIGVIGVVMLLLLLGNILQIGIWALLFRLLGEFEQFSEAYYHSAVNFATLGYGDIVMSEKHRLLGPLESLNGVLMVGVSTATLMTAMQNLWKKARQ